METIKFLLHKENTRGMVILVYIELIVLTEIIGAYWGAFWGVVSSSILFLVLLNHFVFTKAKRDYRSLLGLALLPFIRMMGYSIPLKMFPPYLWHLILGIPLAVSIILIARTPYFEWRDWNLDKFPIHFVVLVGLIGIPLGFGGYMIQLAEDQGTGSNIGLIILTAAILLVFTAMLEEILFRGILTDALSDVFYRGLDVLVNILFASMFFGSLSLPFVLYMGFVGLLFSFFAYRTWSLWVSILANWTFKVGFLLIWPLLGFDISKLIEIVLPLN